MVNEIRKSCKRCSKAFETKNLRKIYCSGTCKTLYSREKNNIPPPEFLKKGLNKDFDKYENALSGLENDLLKKGKHLVTKEREVSKKFISQNWYNQEKKVKGIIEDQRRIANIRQKKIELINSKAIDSPETTNTLLGGALGLAASQVIDKKTDPATTFFMMLIGGFIGKEIGKEQANKDIQIKANQLFKLRDEILFLQKEVDKKSLIIAQEKRILQAIPRYVYKTVIEKYQIEVPLSDFKIDLPIAEPVFAKNKNSDVKTNSVKTNFTTTSVSDLKARTFKSLDFEGKSPSKWFELLGNPTQPFRMMIYGLPGQGKSTFSINLAEYLAENFGRVLFNSSEEGLSQSLKNKLANINSNYFDISEARNFNDLKKVLKNAIPAPFLFIDSINDMKLTLSELKELGELDPNRSIIYIMQATKSGEFKGGSEFAHENDIKIRIEKYEAIVEKNRYK